MLLAADPISAAGTPLAQKRVLLICPHTFNYHTVLRNGLSQLGANVDFFPEPAERADYVVARRLGKSACEFRKQLFRRSVARRARAVSYDFILVIRGEFLNAEFCRWLRDIQPQARMVMYQWDSLAGFDYRALRSPFDKVASFDPADCAEQGLCYMPLFFSQDFERIRTSPPPTQAAYDLMFVGTLHSDRCKIALALADQAASAGMTAFLYFYMTPTSYVKRAWLTRQIERKTPHLQLRRMSRERLLEVFARSRCVIDVNHPQQTGLTIRTMETLGSGRKLITTNEHIVHEPFYRLDTVSIVDRQNPTLDIAFVRNEHGDAPMGTYRLDRWLTQLLRN